MSDPLSPWGRVEAALAVLSVDPAGVKGLWLRARSGPVRDAVVQALPLGRRIHPGIDDVALFGGVDLAATLSAGQLRRSAGILSGAEPVVLTMAERCPPALSARLSLWLDGAGPCLVALDEGAEAEEVLASGLADRLGLFLDLGDIGYSESGAILLPADQIAAARGRLAGVVLPKGALESLTTVALAMGIASLRAPLLAIAVARALAAWRGEAVASEDTLRHAAELTLAHRGDLPDAGAPEQDSTPPPPDPGEAEAEQPQHQDDRIPDDILLEAVRAALPADLLARLAAGKAARAAKGSGGTGAARKGNHRGRPLPPRPGVPGSGKRIDLVATLRAAAPWQPLRRRSPDATRLEIRASDLRLKRYQETSDRVLIFAVDASGSSALSRLAEAKGAIELLLAQAYARRDHVALIAFRGLAAEVLLPPTRSLVQTKRRLSGLPGGGGTPLAAGLKMAFDLSLQTRARGMTPTIALLTDGRGNIALDGSANRIEAEADAQRLSRLICAAAIPALVLDIASRPQAALQRMAASLGAAYVPLPRADAQRLSGVLQAALGA
ncbi:magnesium-chelatase 60 kDa subunit [Cypionkella aquatica]|uniref:Magnesium-chelatase 60 kDa subunit n=1 Tax=Cypionkella aquatica TaxID=1756042 RepID=A0AA37U184_9RHOB|nr:magnesium chelatase subunit D [Cypionkella aquatica]GLS88823.1 magnesium-chelatase 60 kDa subunit [Cypionkella aquatica]